MLVVFLYDLAHHVDVLLLTLAVAVDHAEDFGTAGLHCEEGVEAVYPLGQMQHGFALEEMSVLEDGVEVGLVGSLVLQTALKGLGSHVVYLRQMLRVL